MPPAEPDPAAAPDPSTLPVAHRDYTRRADLPVERTPVLMECAATRNGNPLFWDPAEARRLAGGEVTPPSMLATWCRPHMWRPGNDDGLPMPMQIHFDLKDHFRLPSAVVADYVMTLHDPVQIGDLLTTTQRLISVSGQKTTRLGTGRFWTFGVDYHNQSDQLVGVEEYTMFAFVPAADTAQGGAR